MKKKINLSEVKISSFVTELNGKQQNNIKGKGGLPETVYSCMAYITCDVINCYLKVES